MKELYENALKEAMKITEKNMNAFMDAFPHVSTNNRCRGEENALWTSSFYLGMCCLAYKITGDSVFLKHTNQVLDSLCTQYATRDMPDSNGMLAEGMYHRDDRAGKCVIWGDYFYMKALVRMKKEWNPYW